MATDQSPSDAFDRTMMELAIAEARQCVQEPGRVSPSPRVGAVAARDGEFLGAAHRGEQNPGEHAEFTLLEKKLKTAPLAGATIFTTLEPCTQRNEPKKPCAVHLARRNVARVVIGTLDPDPRIQGEGVQFLRERGIAVSLFATDLVAQIEELDRDFREDRRRQRKKQQSDTRRRVGFALVVAVVVGALAIFAWIMTRRSAGERPSVTEISSKNVDGNSSTEAVADKSAAPSAGGSEPASTIEIVVDQMKRFSVINHGRSTIFDLKVHVTEYKMKVHENKSLTIESYSKVGGAIFKAVQLKPRARSEIFDLTKSPFLTFSDFPADDEAFTRALLKNYCLRVSYRDAEGVGHVAYRVTGSIKNSPSFFENLEDQAISGPPGRLPMHDLTGLLIAHQKSLEPK